MCARSIMLNILGEADGEEGMARAHEVMARAYAVRPATAIPSCGLSHAVVRTPCNWRASCSMLRQRACLPGG